MEIPIPVYFVEENEELSDLHDVLRNSAEREKESSVASRELRVTGEVCIGS